MVYWYESVLLYIASCLVHSYGVDPSCECVAFQSSGLSQGMFHSPNYPSYYKSDLNCILYEFVGDVNELVEIKFVAMDLKAPVHTSPTHSLCRDRLRIFMNLERPEINEDSRWDDEICGNLSNMEDKKFYSSGRALILEFHSGPDSGERHQGFKGVYSFLENSVFHTDGLIKFGTQCSYFMQSDINHTKGEFYSPRYPQKYPKQSNCQYIFMGHEHEKVKVVFKHIRLPSNYSGNCDDSGDRIKVYDGKDSSSKLVHVFCDTHNQKEILSNGPYLYIEFLSDRHREKQGFAAEYQFLDARLAIPTESNDSGTGVNVDTSIFDCNESIVSRDYKKNGSLQSPYYPNAYPSGIICVYEFTAEGQERIQLNFTSINLHYTAGDPNDPYECSSQDSITVIVFIDEKEKMLGEYCGKKIPPQLMSNGRRMKVVFRSDTTQKDIVSGFKIDYSFRTDYGVLGNGVQDSRKVCSFSFDSKLQNNGYFTSPNYGGQYPRNTECHYIFYGKRDEKVEIQFLEFEVDGIIPRCDKSTESDTVSFSNWLNTEDRQMPRFCGNKQQNTQVTSDAAFFRVTFKSNHKYDAKGFKARYHFKKTDEYDFVTPVPNTQVREGTGATSHGVLTVSTATLVLLFQTVIFFVL